MKRWLAIGFLALAAHAAPERLGTGQFYQFGDVNEVTRVVGTNLWFSWCIFLAKGTPRSTNQGNVYLGTNPSSPSTLPYTLQPEQMIKIEAPDNALLNLKDWFYMATTGGGFDGITVIYQ